MTTVIKGGISMETAQERKTGGILGTIERVGNKLPHPFILFLYIIVILVAASAILAGMGVQVVNPTTQETVYVRNLLSRDGLVWLLENMIGNFSGFAPLGMVLAMQMAIGLAESERSCFWESTAASLLKLPSLWSRPWRQRRSRQ